MFGCTCWGYLDSLPDKVKFPAKNVNTRKHKGLTKAKLQKHIPKELFKILLDFVETNDYNI